MRTTGDRHPNLPPVEDDDLILIAEDDEIAVVGQHGQHDSGDRFPVPVPVHRQIDERCASTTSVDLDSNRQRQSRNHPREERHLDTGAMHKLQTKYQKQQDKLG